MSDSVTTTPDGLGGALHGILLDFKGKTTEEVEQAVKTGARVAKAQLVSTSPSRTGEYAAGWSVRTKHNGDATECVVYNAGKPGLTHLLEKGHGGPKPAGARVHIAPAYEAGKAAMENALEK